MAVPANLVVNLTFNPPEIVIVGPIKETTVQKLQSIFPQVCTSSPGQKSLCQFMKVESPPHWYCKLSAGYCNEEMGQSQIMLTIMDCLEEEGGWKLKASNALNHDDTKVTYKFFFVQKL
eukprot:NODE_10008_length_498_cov_46.555256_g9985_i0.p1 GENE.NODE_10008_length_498_cov_46.555256_g9985_i0~~NODE_10008_length_498_cov_46.555256_g9985_i0.p1  ORF type:complete len:119 (-),score=21.18 NODE_10008_length_498_cov_46.555256_g9985_i0:72-428(-)